MQTMLNYFSSKFISNLRHTLSQRRHFDSVLKKKKKLELKSTAQNEPIYYLLTLDDRKLKSMIIST